MEERFVDIETRLAYQDLTLETLNAVVTSQGEQIDRLERRLQELQELLAQVLPDLPRTGPSPKV
jgi:SlyX protein